MKFFSDLWRAVGISRPEPVPLRPPRPLNRLELHVTHACNLTCDSCCHYSNHGHRGNLDPALADRWMAAWRDRVAVAEFNLLGGEPTIHPRLPEFVTLVRRHWPAAYIRIITNGFFLHRHPDLPATLAAAGNAEIALSVHHDEPGYLRATPSRFRSARSLAARSRDQGGHLAVTSALDATLPRLRLYDASIRGRKRPAKLGNLSSPPLQAAA